MVFIGITQNGKSSLIQSILKYGYDFEAAERVQIGKGTFATTKTVSSYKLSIRVRNQICVDETGNRITPDNTTDMNDVATSEEDSGHHIHLNMLDTPGMSDSENIKAASNIITEDRLSVMKLVDEEHKLSILTSLNAAERIHAICFVINKTSTLGYDIQAQIKGYLKMFEASSVYPKYHVAFTHVNDPFDPDLVNKKSAFRNTFNISPKFHYINNVPTKYIPGSQYFADRSLSQMFDSFRKDSSIYVGNLKYPKVNDAYQINDRLLELVYKKTLIPWLNDRTKSTTEEIEAHQLAKQPLLKSEQITKDQWHKCREKIREHDTDKLIEVGTASGSDFGLFNPPRIRLSVETEYNTIIRESPEKWSSKPGHWSEERGGEGV